MGDRRGVWGRRVWVAIGFVVLAAGLPMMAGGAARSEGRSAPNEDGRVDQQPVRRGEVIEARSPYSKTFSTGDSGVFLTEVYPETVHFEDDGGELVEFDTTLVAVDDGKLVAAATPVAVEIDPAPGAPALVKVADRVTGAAVSFGLLDQPGVGGTRGVGDNSVVLEGLAEGVRVELEVLRSGVKETLTLDGPEVGSEFRYRLDLDGVEPSPDGQGGIAFADDSGSAMFVMPRGFMRDASGVISDGVYYDLEQRGGFWHLTVSLDAAWLEEPDREFPVIVDPLLATMDSFDTTITEGIGADQSAEPTLRVGWDGTARSRALTAITGAIYYPDEVRTIFNPIGEEPETLFAEMTFESHDCGADPTDFELRGLVGSWPTGSVTWANAPAPGDRIDSGTTTLLTASACTDGRARWAWDISSYAQQLGDGTATYNGIALTAADELGTSEVQFTAHDPQAPTTSGGVIRHWFRDAAAADQPEPPAGLGPTGPVETLTPTLTASFESVGLTDPGFVLYMVRDDTGTAVTMTVDGTAVAPGRLSNAALGAGVLDWDRTYTLEAWSIRSDHGPGYGVIADLLNNVTNASSKVTTTFTPSTAPRDPAAIDAVGESAHPTPTFSALYVDRNGQDGHVEFEIVDTGDDQRLLGVPASSSASSTVLAGARVPSGSTSSATVPEGILELDGNYEVHTTSVDSSGNRSGTVTTTYAVTPPPGPVYNGDFPDPAIVHHQGTFYAFGTNVDSPTELNVPRLSTDDLSDWGAILQPNEALDTSNIGDWASTQTGLNWAPDVHRFGQNWVLYYGGVRASGPHAGELCIGTAVSAAGPGGVFVDGDGQGGAVEEPLVCADGGVIDPSVFEDLGGDRYLLWKTDMVCGPPFETDLMIRKLDSTGLGFDGPAVNLLGHSESWEAFLDCGPLSRQVEQPEMVYRAGTYFLFYAGNQWDSTDYAIGYAVCDTPTGPCVKVTDDGTGPWFAGQSSSHSPTTFVTSLGQGPGAASFTADRFGATWMAYHAWKPDHPPVNGPNERGLYIAKVGFTGATPMVDVSHPAAASAMIDIDPDDALGGGNSAGRSINERGEIAGTAATSTGGTEAVWWGRDLQVENLGPTSTEPEAYGSSISDNTVLAGYTFGPTNAERAVRWHPRLLLFDPPSAITYLDSLAEPLPYWPLSDARANSTNNSMLTVGGTASYLFEPTPASWDASGQPSRLITTGQFRDWYGEAIAVNNWGTSTGYVCPDVLCTDSTGFLKPPHGEAVALGSLGGTQTIPRDINESDVVVGSAQTPSGQWRAVLWDGQTTDIASSIPGATESHAHGINDHGQVVGTYLDPSGNAQGFLWKDGVILAPLGDLGGGQTRAYAINNGGLITGTSRTTGGDWHAFLRGSPDPSESLGDTNTLIIDGPGKQGQPPGAALKLAMPPNVDHHDRQVCLDIRADTGSGHPLFGFVGARVNLSDNNGQFSSASHILQPHTPDHPIPDSSFNTNNRWPVTVNVTAEVGQIHSWSLRARTC